MVELIMFFGIGFLAAALLGLIIIPVVHNRAVRLTKRRIETAIPLTTAEVTADKDRLRAEFALSARRLEIMIEELKARNAQQLAELGRKADAINRLKIEISEKTAAIVALEARDKPLRDTVQKLEVENTQLQTMLTRIKAEHDQLAHKEGELQREAQERSKVEKIENDFLRERINVIAAEIVRLASAGGISRVTDHPLHTHTPPPHRDT